VIVVDDLSTGSADNLAAAQEGASRPELTFHQADLVTWDRLHEVVAEVDRIYHLAAVVGVFRVLADPVSVLRTNITGTELLFREIARCASRPQTVIASSSEVYGPANDCELDEDLPLTVESTSDQRWTYAVSKLVGENMALTYANACGFPLVVARIFNTTGPRQTGDYGMVVPRFVEQAVSGSPITIYGGGSQKRCFADVRDVVVALDLLASQPRAHGQVVNVGSDREVSIGELAERVRSRSGSGSELQHLSYEEAYGGDFPEFAERRPSLEKLRRLTGFEHRFTLEQTLDELIAHARAARGRAEVLTEP
jgi:UDP-glucose 4-epimerase